jgi:hypothetical protein
MFIARNLTYYPGILSENSQELSDEIIIPSYYLNRLFNQIDIGDPLLLTLTNLDKNISYTVSFGTPHNDDKNTIYVPQWILDIIDYNFDAGDMVTIKKANIDEIPIINKIIIKPLDPIAFEIDTVACFEGALLNLHTITEGITIPVNIPELGEGFSIFAHIEKVEPAKISRIVHKEVGLEFNNEFRESVEEQVGIFNPVQEVLDTPVSTGTLPIPTVSTDAQSGTQTISDITPEERRRRIREAWANRA